MTNCTPSSPFTAFQHPSGRGKLPALAVAALLALGSSGALAQQFWRTDGTSGTWTGTNWGTSAAGPFTTAYTTNSNVQFTADSTVTFATVSIGNVTVADNRTVTVTPSGTLSTNGAVRTFDIGTGATLAWGGQTWSTTSGVGFIKNGAGTWNIGAQSNALNATNGGFTLNNGTVIVSGNNSFGGSASLLAINGGNIQSSGGRTYANSITLGGNFTNSGTGNATFSGTVGLGAATRTITNSTTSGSRIYGGLISGTAGSGLTFDGAGAGQTYIGNSGNTFTGTISINGSEVGFASNGAFGNAANTIVIDGGRLSAASTAGASVTYTLASTHGIQVGSTAGTSISPVSGGTLTYDGVIADKSGATGAWAKQGSGTLVLGGVSTYSGETSINNGTVQLTTGNNRLPTTTAVNLGQAASNNLGLLDLNGRSQQLAGLNSVTGTNATATNNTVNSASAATLTLGGSGTYSYGDGTNANSGVITGAISLVKTGAGSQALGDVNTFTGTTTINGGTLNAAGAGALGSGTTGTSGIAVNSGGTLLLSGSSLVTDRINNSATLNLNGAVADAAGTVTFNTGGLSEGAAGTVGIGALTLSSNSILDFGAGASVLEFAGSGTHVGGTLFINNWSGLALDGNGIDRLLFSALPNATLMANIQFAGFAVGQTAAISFDGGTYYEIVPVPEPATVFGGLALLGLVGYRERRPLAALLRLGNGVAKL